MKKISILLAFGLLFSSSTAFLVASDHESNYPMYHDDEDDDDDFSIDTDLNNLSLENIENINQHQASRSPESNADKIYFFFSFVDDPNALLNIPIYQQTSIIRTRSILDFPFALTYGFDTRDNNAISLMFYLNSCSAKNFTADSTALSSYFLLGNPAKIATLQHIDDITGEKTAASLAKSLALFDPATVEERRLGGLLESRVIHNRFNLTIQLPILYAERNLQLKPWEQVAIEQSSLGRMLATDGVDKDDFKYQHLVMDQFGFGDLKFKTMYEAYSSNNFDIDCGGFIILPTATALKQGMVGTWFATNNDGRASLNLSTIDVENITTQNQDDIANFFIAAIDKLSSNILNSPLGNNGHVVLAPSINTDWYFARNWKLSSDYSLQVPLPAIEQRFYQRTQTQAEFLAAYDAAYNTDSLNFVYFINQQIQDLFFPYVLPTMVFPGIVFNSTNQFVYSYDTWDYYLGSNFWYQGSEILSINEKTTANFSYDYQGAAAASAAQEKLFGKISYNADSTNYSWSLSLYGDITVWNSGIGNDFTLGLCVDCKF